ncbi:hypothetical protein M977_03653 [Buttiauxella gaviniae ATCC 51604]|uniref:Uncharacterized protein n=1 Tax=Buttiauxella gaviniae ATCC 51604 TaxID=1354253 RepID=A0A1B7HR91_9ENTR|nr:hypothetical protein M977_03653 [Buttiauxella gaviniae ATCC 51604]
MSVETFKISHPHVVFLYFHSLQSISGIKKPKYNKGFKNDYFNWRMFFKFITFIKHGFVVWLV